MDKSPCIGCDLENEDKNGRRCMECDDRVEYVSGLVGRTHASPKGFRLRSSSYAGQDAGQAKGPCVAKAMQDMEGGNKMTILEEKVEEIIKEVCAEEGVELSKLREGKHFKKYTQARKRIAERLVADYGMSQQEIGELTGVSNQAICYLLNKKKVEGGRLKAEREMERHKGTEAEGRGGKNPASPTVTIDFSERKELFMRLEKYAKIEIRSVPDQILYFILHSLSWEETEPEKLEE